MSDQLKTFIELLSGDAGSDIHWQVFHDSDKSDTGKALAKSFSCTVDDALAKLQLASDSGCGCYITINKTDGNGRHANNITAVRACFIDGDNMPLPETWHIEPSAIVWSTPTQWHAYWFTHVSIDFNTWAEVQYKLALYYGCKDKMQDLPRVMRAPGFKHLKDPANPRSYDLTWFNADNRYNLVDLHDRTPLNPAQTQEYQSWLSAPKLKRSADAVDIIDNSVTNVEKFVKRLSGITPETGDLNNTLFRAVNIGKDLGLDEDTVINFIAKWWSNSWDIPVEPVTIKTVVKNAYKYGSNPVGSETTAGKFANAPRITEQVGSTEDLRMTIEGMETVDVKYGANHTTNARVFLQSCEIEGIHYVTVKQETYIFQGTHYRRLEPKELEKNVLSTMLKSRPNNDTVNGTSKFISLLTTNNHITKSPSWITPGDNLPNPKNLIAFKNGILDISTNKWLEHTHDLFYSHCLEYDYDAKATCHNWLRYLNSEVFNFDKELIMQLQEWMGYMLLTSYDFQKIMVFLGAPRSGKGTIAGVIRHIAGPANVIAPTLSKLLLDPTLDLMQDKAIAIIGDAHKVAYNKRDEVLEILKMISGCDPITFSRKYLGSITKKFPTRFTLCSNKMPEFIDSSGAMAGRLLVIPFRNSYLGKEDPKRLEKLLREAPGIMNWALEGAKRLQRKGKFTKTAAGDEILDDLSEQLSPIKAFMVDSVLVTDNKNDTVTEVQMFNHYLAWCAVQDNTPMKSTPFKRDFMSCDYKIHRVRDYTLPNRPRIFTHVKIVNSLDRVTPINAMMAAESV